MTAAPIDIPLDERGAPELQLLVRKLGEAAAAARGEAYDPAHAGYPRITPDIWKAFDEAMAEYQHRPHHHEDHQAHQASHSAPRLRRATG
jgi:hypothetical protein